MRRLNPGVCESPIILGLLIHLSISFTPHRPEVADSVQRIFNISKQSSGLPNEIVRFVRCYMMRAMSLNITKIIKASSNAMPIC